MIDLKNTRLKGRSLPSLALQVGISERNRVNATLVALTLQVSLASLASFVLAVHAADAETPFAAWEAAQSKGDSPPAPWKAQFHPDIKNHTRFEIVSTAGDPSLKVTSEGGYGSWALAFAEPASIDLLDWRWKVLAHPQQANLKTKAGDDSAAKLCLFVKIDESKLGLGTRLALGAARTLSGQDLPAATLCYQWASEGHQTGEMFDNPYTDRVRNLVLRTEPSSNVWLSESRDIRADVIRAFGDELPVQNGKKKVELLGLALGGDSDNTSSQTSAEFAGLSLVRSGVKKD